MATFTGCVEQGGLETDGTGLRQILPNGHLHGVTGVRINIRQGQQVRRPHKEIPVEHEDTDPCHAETVEMTGREQQWNMRKLIPVLQRQRR